MWVPPFEAPELCFYLDLQTIQVLTNRVYDPTKTKAPRQKRGRKSKARDMPGDLPAETLLHFCV